jgi:hypothetical protein
MGVELLSKTKAHAQATFSAITNGEQNNGEEDGAYIEGSVPSSDVEVEEPVKVVDAHRIVVVHLWRPRDRGAGAQPAAPELAAAERGAEKATVEDARLRDGGGDDAEACEGFRHG